MLVSSILSFSHKAFADDKLREEQMMISILDRLESMVRKVENVVHQHFLFFPTIVFKRHLLPQGCKNPELWYEWLTHSHTIRPLDASGKQAF